MGLGAQLTVWPGALFEDPPTCGFHVIRYDNRDTGLSTDFGSWGLPNIPAAIQKLMKGEKDAAPYYLKDMAGDAIGFAPYARPREGPHGGGPVGAHARPNAAGPTRGGPGLSGAL